MAKPWLREDHEFFEKVLLAAWQALRYPDDGLFTTEQRVELLEEETPASRFPSQIQRAHVMKWIDWWHIEQKRLADVAEKEEEKASRKARRKAGLVHNDKVALAAAYRRVETLEAKIAAIEANMETKIAAEQAKIAAERVKIEELEKKIEEELK